MGKTIGELRAEGKSFAEIAKIGEKELQKTAKGRKALKKLKRSVGGRGGKPGKTQAQVEAEERARAEAERKRIEEEREKAKKKKFEDIFKAKSKLKSSKVSEKLISKAPKQQLEQARKQFQQPTKIIRGTIEPSPSPKLRRKIPFIKTISEVEFEGKEEQRKGKPISGFVKRASADVVSGVEGLGKIVKDLNDATFAKPGSEKQVEARKRIGNILTLSTLSGIGASIGADVQSNNPYERARGLTAIVGGVGGVPLKGTKLKPIVSASKYNIKTNLKSGSSKINVKTKGQLTDGTPFKQDATLRIKDKSVVGTLKTTSDGKTKITDLNLKDKGSFYEDVKNKIKIPKSTVGLDDVKVSIREIKSKQNKPDVKRTYEGNIIKTGQRQIEVTKTVTRRSKGKKSTTVSKSRTSDIDFATDVKNKPIDVVSTKKSLNVIANTNKSKKAVDGGIISIKSQLTKIKKAKLKPESITFRIGGNIAEQSKKFKTLKDKIDANKKLIIVREGKLTAKGYLEEINPIKFNFGISPKSLKLTKKQKKSIKNNLEIPKKISVPDLRIKINNVRKLRLKGFITEKRFKDFIKKVNEKLQEKEITPVKKPQEKIPTQANKKIQKPIQKKKTPSKTTTKLEKATIKKVPSGKFPRIKSPLIKKPKVIKLPNIDLDSKIYDNKILQFKAFYRERKNPKLKTSKKNPVVKKTINIKDTRNNALNKVADIADNKAVRSITIELVGISKKIKKDSELSPTLNKFDKKKSKNTPVLKLVEQTPFIRDKPIERSEIRKKSGTVSKKKVSKPKISKKVSNNKSKNLIKKTSKKVISKKPSSKKKMTKKVQTPKKAKKSSNSPLKSSKSTSKKKKNNKKKKVIKTSKKKKK